MQNYKIKTNFISLGLWPLVANKTVFNLLVFIFNIRGKLSIILPQTLNLYPPPFKTLELPWL